MSNQIKFSLRVGDYLGAIKANLHLLHMFRDDGRTPSLELLDDIRAYESIIGAPDAADRAKLYAEERKRCNERPRQIALRLGWMKPSVEEEKNDGEASI